MSRARSPAGEVAVIVTCEHGGHVVPSECAALFSGAGDALASHRGWDRGALPLARDLAASLRAPLHVATVSRLVVDLNRSPHHPRVFSQWTRALDAGGRRALLEGYHTPHRAAVDSAVAELVAAGCAVVHLGVHTFTPVLDGAVRKADVGILYDPARPGERALAAAWAGALARLLPDLTVRRNQPYRGASDGLTTWLRARHGPAYRGIELEVNQRLLGASGRFPARVTNALGTTLAQAYFS